MKEHFVKVSQYLAIVIFLALSGWLLWLVMGEYGPDSDPAQVWSSTYQVLAWFGAVCGIYISKSWGGTKSVLGRSCLAFAIGLLAQSFGQSVFSYYYYSGIEAPYPSLADLGYFGSIPFYIYGILSLSKASGAKLSAKSFFSKVLAVIIPLGLLLVSYYVFLRGHDYDWSSPLTVFLDMSYPLGQSIYLAFAILAYLMTKDYLGGIMRVPVMFFIGALFMQYLAEYAFLYQVSRGIYVGGLEVDYLYLIAYLMMSVSLINLGSVYLKIQKS